MSSSNFESSLLPASWDAAMNKYPRQQGPSPVHRCMGNVKAAALGQHRHKVSPSGQLSCSV